jgi:hypothetical protein
MSNEEKCRAVTPRRARRRLLELARLTEGRSASLSRDLIDLLKPSRKSGRPVTTSVLAEFADQRKHHMTWKEIAKAWSELHPNDQKKSEHVRDAWRRRYRKKNRA